MTTTKLKLDLFLTFALGILGTGTDRLAHRARADKPAGADKQPPAKSDSAPKEEKAERTDAHGDPLPAHAVTRLGTTRFRHNTQVVALAYSADGKTLASAGQGDKVLRLWDAATGKELRQLKGHQGEITAVLFSPDGKMIASSDYRSVGDPDGRASGVVKLWEAATGKPIRQIKLEGDAATVLSLIAFSPDGKSLLTRGEDQQFRLWDVAEGKEPEVLTGSAGVASAAAFSPDGKTLALAGSDNFAVYLWDRATNKERRQLQGHQNIVTSLAFSPDGRTLASSGEDRTVRVWELATGKQRLQLKAPKNGVTNLTYSPDGKVLAVASADSTLRLWNLAAGKSYKTIRLNKGPGLQDLFTGVFNPGTSGMPGTAAPGADPGVPNPNGNYSFPAPAFAFAPDGKTLAAGGEAATIRFWDVATGKERSPFPGHQGQVLAVAFAPDGKTVVSASADRTVRQWDTETGKELRQYQGHQGAVNAVVFTSGGKTLVTRSPSEENVARFWEAGTGKELRQLFGHQDWNKNLIAPTLGFIGTGMIGGCMLGNGFNVLGALGGGAAMPAPAMALGVGGGVVGFGGGAVGALGFGSGLNLGMFGYSGSYAAVVGTNKIVRYGKTGIRDAFALSPNGKLAAELSYKLDMVETKLADGTKTSLPSLQGIVTLWDVEKGKELRQLPSTANALTSATATAIAFAPDSKTVAVADGATVTLWEAATGQKVRQLQGDADWITSLVFSPDGQVLAVAGSDDADDDSNEGSSGVVLWDLASGKELHQLEGHEAVISSVAFSPDGKLLASASKDQTLRLWDRGTGKLLSQVQAHDGGVNAVAFSPDGKNLATGGDDTTVLIWDTKGLLQDGQRQPAPLSSKQLGILWTDLANDDAAQAYQAIQKLATVPAQVVPFLQERLRPVPADDARTKRIAQLIADLDSEDFATRQKAADELEKLGELAENALKKALANKPSLEASQRIERLLQMLDANQLPPEQIQIVRAVEVLELIGTAEARRFLEALAKGAPEARLTREAKDALERVAKRPNNSP